MRSALFSLALLAIGLGACRTTASEAPAGAAQARPIVLEAQRLWRVLEDGRVEGLVVRFAAARDPADPTRHYYSVRNPLGQELGTIDGHGRAWRFEPHQSAPRFVGTGTIVEGARAILGASASAELVEAELSAGPR